MSDIVGYITAMEHKLKDSYNFDFEIVPDNDNPGIFTVRSKSHPSTMAVVDLSGSRVTASSGDPQTGEVNALVNSDFLLADAFYFIDGHIHIRTDAAGRVFNYRALYNRELRSTSIRNIIPSEKFFGRAWYSSQEQFLANALRELSEKDDDWYLEVRIDATYHSPKRVPESLRLEAEIDDAAGYYCSLTANMVG